MSTQEEKQLDDFVRKVITEQRLDEPSPSFVNNVMRKVVAASHKVFVYRPLISTRSWYLIAMGLVVLFGYTFSFKDSSKVANSVSEALQNAFDVLEFSSTVSSSILVILFMIILEVYLIKYLHGRNSKK
ncbi:hypothetical protein [Imtechella halotolerans]|uniref:Uncharacterized protein n=1 Tax=Imtechella halotolerans K1 TaxID=946077 RepID=I0WDN9_9FLAO|nr:hypothetical protein [Imtechella halotolerans]EID74505.1 hypothetical protein W5A_08242 [Imtechella halotolerans K1]WMQ62356.1 hypothetical protein PT603_08405 [Imtechella halotolerans]